MYMCGHAHAMAWHMGIRGQLANLSFYRVVPGNGLESSGLAVKSLCSLSHHTRLIAELTSTSRFVQSTGIVQNHD